MIPQLAECRALNLRSPLFSRTSWTVYSVQSAVASLRALDPFASYIQVSDLHHSSRVSDASAKDSRAKQVHTRPAQTAVGYRPAPQPSGVDDIPSDYARLDGVPPEEGLKRAESCQHAGTLDAHSKYGAAAYSEVRYPDS